VQAKNENLKWFGQVSAVEGTTKIGAVYNIFLDST
jgi:hypothetical protein